MASIKRRPDGRWRGRYRDAAGKEHAKHFGRKTDAQTWLDEVTASIVTGQYVAPKAGRITFKEYAETWRKAQVHRPSTRVHVESMLRNHVYPTFGSTPIGDVLPSQVQAWVKGRESALKPSTIGVVHAYVSSIFSAAVADRRIVANPCAHTKLPKVARNRVVPPTTDEVERLRQAAPDDVKAMITLAAGTGMRQGELFGLTVDRVDFLRRSLHVDRQIVTTNSQSPTFGPPKTDASDRWIPLPQVVIDALSAHLAAYPAEAHETIFRNHWGKPHSRSTFGHNVWRPAVTKAKLPAGTTMHTLRHYYASLLIRHGESVKTVQARLGHASAAETLDTYSHLWPDSDDRTREAVDSVLGNLADSPRTAKGG